MPTIAIVEVLNPEVCEDDYGRPIEVDASLIVGTLPDWTPVTREELESLRQLTHAYSKVSDTSKRKLLILEQLPTKEYVAHSVQWWKELQEKVVAEELARKEAQRVKSEERRAKQRARQLERDKAALKELVESHPDLVRELIEKNNEGNHSRVSLPAVETPSGKGRSRKRV